MLGMMHVDFLRFSFPNSESDLCIYYVAPFQAGWAGEVIGIDAGEGFGCRFGFGCGSKTF